jgi:hypothetical protein
VNVKRLAWTLAFPVLVLVAPDVRAQSAARLQVVDEAVVEGDRYFSEADFVRAQAAFERAYRRTGSLVAGLKSARCLVRLGRLLEAAERYEQIISAEVKVRADTDPASARQDAAVELQQLFPRIPRINITVVGADPRAVAVALNGVRTTSPPPPSGVPVNPGRYLVTGQLGARTLESYVDVGEGDVGAVSLEFGPSPEAKKVDAQASREERSGLSGVRLAGVVTFGVGVASLVTGSFIGWNALRDESSLAERCPQHRCPARLQSEVDAYEAKKLMALVGIGAGGVLILSGAMLYIAGPASDAPRVGAYVAPQGAGVWGAF